MKTSDIIIAHPGSDDKFEALNPFNGIGKPEPLKHKLIF
jgi:hypothetical protein